MSSTSSHTLQVCRECGGGAPIDAHFCPQCTKILSLGRHGDYFAFFGLPRKLHVDAADLERRFRDLSRQFHPDYFYNATAAERRASLERSSYLNDAYRVLKHPAARVDYLLEVEGMAAKGPQEASKAVPPALLEEVFATEEQWKSRLDRARAPIDAKRAEHEKQLRELSARWDALVDANAPDADRREALTALRDRVLERNYISNLLASIERELTT
jgi:molecular chaperone HscB